MKANAQSEEIMDKLPILDFKDEIVLDPFCGAGTTAIAALKTSLARDNATGNGIDGLIFFKDEDQVITEEIHIDM